MSASQGAGKGSLYIGLSFVGAGALTFAFQGISMRALGGPAGYAPVALLWNATFLVVQVLWVAATQTLGRHVAEREARNEDWSPVVSSVMRWQGGLLVLFLLVALLLSPLLTTWVFEDPRLTVAFVAAVALYAPEYFRRGIFNGHRQSTRMGAQILAEASSRVVIAAGLLFAGLGVAGPALAIMLAPIIGVLAVRPARVPKPSRQGEPFSAGKALRFAAPVLACMACAQTLASGGVILVGLLGGTGAQVGLFGAALIFTRIPQYVLSPVIGALLPHASRALSLGGQRSLDRFVIRAVGVVGVAGIVMVGGAWTLGEWGLKLFGGSRFEAEAGLLAALAALAAFYLLTDTLAQALFALGRSRLAAVGWGIGLVSAAICLPLISLDVTEKVAYSLVIGAFAAALAQVVFYLAARNRPYSVMGSPGP
ncbi:MAG: oligosaccharide flippase family protein [Rubrobacter sp.]|nr:oligosaccharide flippase family protein [Rubrobacter sp.]